MFRRNCPNCNRCLIGVKFREKGYTDWEGICRFLPLQSKCPAPPSFQGGYYALLTCPDCGTTMSDLPVAMTDGYEQWKAKTKLYEDSDCLTEGMLQERGPRTEMEIKPPPR